ncbi:hypothetical protein VTJ83DRAFT_3358 [Remersonia thermophila]|uniref:Uncharacterized protein n=1 Tax=Remersonia thermophila TaxID=72144 RepID=A0ABR4DE27_9PEZI
MPSSQYDPWMPAPMLLQPNTDLDDADIDDLNLSKMDDDPFRYFLSPASSAYADDENMDFDMDFDAGIEDSRRHHAASRLFRNISPPSLAGFGRRPHSPSQHITPPRSPETPELDYDLSSSPDDHEQYEYMDTSSDLDNTYDSWPRRVKNKFKSSSSSRNQNIDNFLSPSALPDPFLLSRPPSRASTRRSDRGSGLPPLRSSSAGGVGWRSGGGGGRGTPGRISPHAWREPSPDVWAIEEEPEAEDEEMQDPEGVSSGRGRRGSDMPAAKPRKRVRFALPASDDIRDGYH